MAPVGWSYVRWRSREAIAVCETAAGGRNCAGLDKGCIIQVEHPTWGGIRFDGKADLEDQASAILNRWKSIEGHARGVEKMIEDDAYCVDILKQTLAIQGAIEKVNGLILEDHLQSCVTTAIRGDDSAERERVISELMDVFKGSGHLRRVASTGDVIAQVADTLATKADRGADEQATVDQK